MRMKHTVPCHAIIAEKKHIFLLPRIVVAKRTLAGVAKILAPSHAVVYRVNKLDRLLVAVVNSAFYIS